MPTANTSNANIATFKKQSDKSTRNLAHFFSPVDSGSSMPSWYYKAQVEEEQEWIKRAEDQLKQNLIPQEKILEVRGELTRRRDKVKEIMAAQASVEERITKDKDKYAQRFTELGEIIGESLYTRDEMFNRPSRVINPHNEAERTTLRNNIIKEWKIIGRVLGEDTNIERLRKGH